MCSNDRTIKNSILFDISLEDLSLFEIKNYIMREAIHCHV